jgi:eukaryotic-like serine/threonine-protein kinase
VASGIRDSFDAVHHRTSAETPLAIASDSPPAPTPGDGAPAPRFEDDGVVGRGGMGQVHRIYDRNIRRFAALKVLERQLAAEPAACMRFLAEAQITGQLEHPNIVPVYDLELLPDGGPKHFLMKLVDGNTLTHFIDPDRIAMRTDAELWELLNVFLKVCEAVSYAHSRGVVHRDLKPDNVMIGSHGQVYVMDWGVSSVVGKPMPAPAPTAGGHSLPASDSGSTLFESFASFTRSGPVEVDVDTRDEGSVVGTYQYMAPEQAWGRTSEIDSRSDVFALGGILFHILTGRAPYEGTKVASPMELARGARVPHPSEVAPGTGLSPALCAIAVKALEPAREDRYQSVEALKRDVERAQRGGLSLGTRVFRAGMVIVREGDPPDAAYILTRGRCEAYKTLAGEKRLLREMGAGDVFGEMALLSSRSRSATVVALDDVTAIVVTPEALAREVHSESWLLPLLKTLVERFRELEERIGT